MVHFLAYLSQMPKNLTMVRCCHWHHWFCHCHLWTVLIATGLIIETSYLACMCTYAPSKYTWNIKSIWPMYLNGNHFLFSFYYFLPTWLIIGPSYFTKMCIGTRAMHTKITRLRSHIFSNLWTFCHMLDIFNSSCSEHHVNLHLFYIFVTFT